jgi:hypothetical protein
MTANSANLSAFNCLASFVKTILSQLQGLAEGRIRLTQTRREKSNVQVRHELLLVCIEHSLPRNNVSWQSDTHNLHHRFEYQQYEVAEGRVGLMVVCSPCEEGECGGRDGWGVIARNNGIESIGRWVGEKTHLVRRIDGLDRVLFEGWRISSSRWWFKGLALFLRR